MSIKDQWGPIISKWDPLAYGFVEISKGVD